MAHKRGRPTNDSLKKLHRSETVTLRLTPQVRFIVDLATRITSTTVSGFIETAVKNALRQDSIRHGDIDVRDLAQTLWDPLEPDRFVKLALACPDLLTYDEQVVWKCIQEDGAFWRDAVPNLPVIRAQWKALKEAAHQLGPDGFPAWCLP